MTSVHENVWEKKFGKTIPKGGGALVVVVEAITVVPFVKPIVVVFVSTEMKIWKFSFLNQRRQGEFVLLLILVNTLGSQFPENIQALKFPEQSSENSMLK